MTKPSSRVITLLLALLISSRAADAADDLAPARQAALLLRVLPYDRSFPQRATDSVTIAVVYREGDPASTTYALDMTMALRDLARGTQVRGLPVRVISIGYSGTEGFEAALARQRLAAIYVCPGLGEVLDSISATSRRLKILSFSGRELEVREKLSIGLLRRGARPALIVNLRAATAEGADLEPDLLGLSEVVR